LTISATISDETYWVDDVPVAPLVFELSSDQEPPVELDGFEDVEVSLTDPAGVSAGFFSGSVVDDTVIVLWPDTTPFATPGVYAFVLRMVALDERLTLAPVQIVVQDVSEWQTLDSARAAWLDAPDDDFALFALLQNARTAILKYGTTLTDPAEVRAGRRQAQLMQARAVWNATKSNDQGEVGPEGYAIRVYPLDKNIRQLLRPNSALPVMF